MSTRTNLVLAAATLASIATSMIPNEWYRNASAPIELTLDAAAPVQTWDVVPILTTPQPFVETYGSVAITLQLQAAPAGETDAVVDVRFRRLGVVVDMETVRLAPSAVTTITMGDSAFVECEASPCADEHELVLEHLPLAGAPAVTITGTATVDVYGRDPDEDNLPPPGTSLTIDLTPRALQ